MVILQNAFSRSVGRPNNYTLASVISIKALLLVLNRDKYLFGVAEPMEVDSYEAIIYGAKWRSPALILAVNYK